MALPVYQFPKTSLFLPDKPEAQHRLEIDADLDRLFLSLRQLTSVLGGLPGGSDTHVQFNNAGLFGGNANFRYVSGTSVNLGQNLKLILDDNGGSADSYWRYNSSNSYVELYVDGELRIQL